jgi:hypothetical protein
MITVDLTQIPAISADDAYMLTGVPAEEFNQPGIFRALIGPRGEVEEFEFLGEVAAVKVPTLEEVIADYDARDEEDRQDAAQYFEEFYGLAVEEDHVNFGYTEEGYDVWVRIG